MTEAAPVQRSRLIVIAAPDKEGHNVMPSHKYHRRKPAYTPPRQTGPPWLTLVTAAATLARLVLEVLRLTR